MHLSALGIPGIRELAAPAARRRHDVRGRDVACCRCDPHLRYPPGAGVRAVGRLVGLSPFAGDDRFNEIPVVDAGKIAGLDPLFINGVCRFDLADDPEGITVEARDRFGRSRFTTRPVPSFSA